MNTNRITIRMYKILYQHPSNEAKKKNAIRRCSADWNHEGIKKPGGIESAHPSEFSTPFPIQFHRMNRAL